MPVLRPNTTIQTSIWQEYPGIKYFLSADISDISGYKLIHRSKSGLEQNVQVLCTPDTETLVAGPFISELADPSILFLPQGDWRFQTWSYLDNLSGTNYLIAKVYTRTAIGVETFRFQITSDDINSTSYALIQESTTAYTLNQSIAINVTDRLVIRIYALCSYYRHIHLLYSGNNYASNIVTTISRPVDSEFHERVRDFNQSTYIFVEGKDINP